MSQAITQKQMDLCLYKPHPTPISRIRAQGRVGLMKQPSRMFVSDGHKRTTQHRLTTFDTDRFTIARHLQAQRIRYRLADFLSPYPASSQSPPRIVAQPQQKSEEQDDLLRDSIGSVGFQLVTSKRSPKNF